MGVEDYYADLFEAIEELVEQGELEEGTAAYGVAQKLIYFSYDDLSPQQKFVYDKYLAPLLGERAEQHKINARIYNADD